MSTEQWLDICRSGTLICAVGAGLCTIAAGGFVYGTSHFTKLKGLEDKKQAAMSGELVPSKDNKTDAYGNLSPEIRGRLPHDNLITVKLGGVSLIHEKQNLSTGISATSHGLGMGDIEPIHIKFINNTLLVSTRIVGDDRKIIAELIDNHWRVNPNQIYLRNYDSNGVEVIDEYGHVVLSVDMANPNYIVINGIFTIQYGYLFASPEGTGPMYALNEKWTPEQKDTWRKSFEQEANKIPKLFIYTGKDTLGKRGPKV